MLIVNNNPLGTEGARYLVLTNLYLVLYSPLRIILKTDKYSHYITQYRTELREEQLFFQLQNGIKGANEKNHYYKNNAPYLIVVVKTL